MSILCTEQIHEYMKKDPNEALVITPLLDPSQQVGDCSVDLRLGNEFIVTRKTSFPAVDPTKIGQGEKKVESYQEKIRLRFHEEFVLHPNQLVLGSTLEYVALPKDHRGGDLV